MKIQHFFRTVFVTLLLLTVYSCSDDDDTTFPPASETIADFVAETPDYSSLLAALQKAELVGILSGNGPFTVFAPNNAAFDAFLGNLGVTLNDLSKEDLTPILLNHVLSGEFVSTQLSTGYVENEADVSTYINTADGVKINGDITVTMADVDRSNGVIHAVDKVIPLPTMLTFVAADTDLSSLATTATTTTGFDTDFAAVLGGADSDLTLLAPTNQAFTDAASALEGASVAAIEQTLLNHVIAGTNLSSGLSTGYGSTLAEVTFGQGNAAVTNNINIYINTDSGVTFNGIADVTTPDIKASNGVIHIVDTVITLPTVVTFATADANFSTLVTALTTLTPSTDFVTILSRTEGSNADNIDPPFTAFAPTDDAFAAATLPDNESEISRILLYHVAGGANVRSTDITDGQMVTTLETGMFTINTTDGVKITDEQNRVTNVGPTDVQAVNGVIHVIDQVLLPAPGTP